jgi:hypothetical protein
MEKKIYRKVVKRVVMFVAALFLLFPGMSFAEVPTYLIELEDYGISVYDVSGDWCEAIDDELIDGIDEFDGFELRTCSVVTMDTKGKLTGIETLSVWDPILFEEYELLVTADLKGTFKRGGNGINKYKTKAKGTGTFLGEKLTFTDEVKKELTEKLEDGEDFTSWNGEQKLKFKVKGEGTIKQEEPIVDLVSGLDGDAVVGVLAVLGEGRLILEPEWEDLEDIEGDLIDWDLNDWENIDDYSLNAKVKNNSKKNLTKVKCKGETEKGLKIKLKIDDAIWAANELLDPLDVKARICTKITGKVLGQKLNYKK